MVQIRIIIESITPSLPLAPAPCCVCPLSADPSAARDATPEQGGTGGGWCVAGEVGRVVGW